MLTINKKQLIAKKREWCRKNFIAADPCLVQWNKKTQTRKCLPALFCVTDSVCASMCQM